MENKKDRFGGPVLWAEEISKKGAVFKVEILHLKPEYAKRLISHKKIVLPPAYIEEDHREQKMGWLRLILGFLKTFWWVVVLVLAFIATGILLVINFGKRGQIDNAANSKTKKLVEIVAERVHDAVTDVKVERAIISERTSVKRQEIEEIKKEPDGKKRRERLAEILRKSL